jgi:hypothetical protein
MVYVSAVPMLAKQANTWFTVYPSLPNSDHGQERYWNLSLQTLQKPSYHNVGCTVE